MSYNARPGPGYPPGYQPGPPPPRQTPQRRQPQPRGGFGCFSFILGFVVALLIGGGVIAFLYFYNPNGAPPLTRPSNALGTPDITATLSQDYLNNEIGRSLKAKPFEAGQVTLNDAVITVKNDSQVDVAMQARYGSLATFNLTITEQVSVENGQVKLTLVGQPKLTNGQLPPGVTGILQQINTSFIEPKLNEQVTKIVINGRNLKLTGLSSTTGLLTVQATVQ